MRPIHLARMEKVRPVLILTREAVRAYRASVTVAPITSTIRGLSTEVPVGRPNGLAHDSVIVCDNVTTIPSASIGRHLGYLLQAQEGMLTEAILAAYDLDIP